MKKQKTKSFVFLGGKKIFFTIGPSKPLKGQTHLGSGSTKKMLFHFSLFDLKLIKCDHFQ
jgi:hypothetical protein